MPATLHARRGALTSRPTCPRFPGAAPTPSRKGGIGCVDNLGSHWTIERVLVSHDSNEAVIEWTHWKRKTGTAQRGDEWYVFDPESGLIAEIRAYYAAPAVKDIPIGELVEFDYKGRGYHVTPE